MTNEETIRQLQTIAAMQISHPEVTAVMLHKQLNVLDKHIRGCNAMAKHMDDEDIDIADIKKQLKNALVCNRVLAEGQSAIIQALLVYIASGSLLTDANKAAIKLGADPGAVLSNMLKRKMAGSD